MLELLSNVFVQPLMAIYGFVFLSFSSWVEVGPCIILFSVTLNLALVPLYRQMERRSQQARAKRALVQRDVARMKRHFRGRERYYYVRAVYRQYGYRPISELLGSADLFVQIIVFITVYHYLSGLAALHGTSLGPIADLGKPDHLLGPVNLLPLLMTTFNVAAVFSYVEDRSKRLQAIALAILFLVLLYSSASGLVIYWTMNNLFSLARNVLRPKLAAQQPGFIGRKLAELATQR
jgi:membrane protein insertase Oxa1/YidC/SpoIIIJ